MEEVDGACAGCGTDVVAVFHHGVFVVYSDLELGSAVGFFTFQLWYSPVGRFGPMAHQLYT